LIVVRNRVNASAQFAQIAGKIMRVSIIADDLTGAADSGASLVDHGASLHLGLDAFLGAGRGPIAAVDLDVRENSEVAAPAFARAAAHARSDADTVLFAKVDSTLRGPVEQAVEALAIVAAGAPVLVCPAFPDQGRFFVNGRGYVGAVPVEASPFGREQNLADGHSDLFTRLRRRGHAPVLLKRDVFRDDRQLDAALEGLNSRIALFEAVDQGDLDRMAHAALRAARGACFVGAAGFARSIAAAIGPAAPRIHRPVVTHGPILFVLGTATQLTRAQLHALDGVRIVEAGPSGGLDAQARVAVARTIAAGRDCAVVLPRGGPGRPDPALVRRLAASLPDDVAGAESLVLSGGATARAVLDALGIDHLDLVAELEPGIAVARAGHGSRGLNVVLKAGGFGTAQTLANIQRALRMPAVRPNRMER
jgi:uncharacterized protein YgbK (DUF1537 family)